MERPLNLLTLLFPLTAAMLRGAAQPLIKLGLANWPSPFAAVTIGYVISAFIIGGFVLALRNDHRFLDSTGFAWFAAVGIVNGAAVLLLYMALDQGPVTIVAPLVACYPLVTLLLGRILLRDNHLSKLNISGILLTVLGAGFLLNS